MLANTSQKQGGPRLGTVPGRVKTGHSTWVSQCTWVSQYWADQFRGRPN
jgi:hypothetical protein